MSRNAREIAEIKNAVRNLKLQDLQAICNYANFSRAGRKQEILERILQYLDEGPNFAVKMKIKELCKKANSGAPVPRINVPSTSGPSTSADMVGSGHHGPGMPLPSIRPHPGPSTSNQINFHAPHASMPQSMNSHIQSPAIMRLHTQQIPGNVPLNTNINALSGAMAGAMHHNTPINFQSLPVHPDVRLSPHPFYEQQHNGELMRIKTLMNNTRPFVAKGVYEATFPFHLTPQQANMIFENRVEHIVQKRTDFGIQVLVRFCKYDVNSEQDDALPIHLALRCNGTPVPLCNPIPTNKPGMDGRRLGRPINITPQVRVSPTVPNFITVTWHFDPGHHLQSQIYALGVYLVKRLSPKDLMNKLSKKGVKPPEFAKYMIKEKMTSADSEIMTNKLRTSLRCPLGKMRIEKPLRGNRCTHLQCFDAYCYLAMNERRPTWRCPYCDQPATFGELYIDGFYKDVLSRCDSSVSTVEFSEDGSWLAVREDEDEEEDDVPPPPKPQAPVAVKTAPTQVAPHVQPLVPQPPAEGDAANAGDASVIDLTEGSDEEGERPASSAPAAGESSNETVRQSTKREMDTAVGEGPASKRTNLSTSPEIICIDSSDDEEESSARPSSPKSSNGRATVEAPDSTTPVGTTLDAAGPSKSCGQGLALQTASGPVASSSDAAGSSGLFMNHNGLLPDFPPNMNIVSNSATGAPFPPSQFVSGPVFPGAPSRFFQP